jgi:UDP-N-acetylglucosamine 4,6-dehydratase/5-epimerase
MFENKIILIVGGSGSWGQELTKQLLLFNPKKIIIFSRGEILQIGMERKFNNKKIKFVIGDVRDKKTINDIISQNIDFIYYLAALKHIPTCENFPHEAIQTNILGISNAIEAAIKYKVKKFINVSTDKAVDPSNIYGLTKAIAEKLTIQVNCETDQTEFICIRSGNVLGTNGSIVPFIIDQIRINNLVQLMDNRMTRFFISFPQTIKFLIFVTEVGIGGEIYIINMPSFHIIELIKLLVEYYGNIDTKINIIGAREGEKIHELLISQNELSRVHFVNNNNYVIYPQIKTGRIYKHNWENSSRLISSLSSEDNIKDKDCLINLLKEGGYL